MLRETVLHFLGVPVVALGTHGAPQNSAMAAGTSSTHIVVLTSARHTSSVGTLKLGESISAAIRQTLKLDRRSVLDFKFALEALSLETADGLQYLPGICAMQVTLYLGR
ncbi:unnamed protein product [Polarella glacialis]|uniref:Uncharacterized protein n=1 Tax=Polarella glacialis TaxID=89957 RepID=A0A813KPL7_POLGL|nr:unnamed protein product [Polarella glacialis]